MPINGIVMRVSTLLPFIEITKLDNKIKPFLLSILYVISLIEFLPNMRTFFAQFPMKSVNNIKDLF